VVFSLDVIKAGRRRVYGRDTTQADNVWIVEGGVLRMLPCRADLKWE
jgi:hypothetical protein